MNENILCELKKLQVHVNKLGLNNSESTYGTYNIKFKIDETTYTGILNIHDDVNVIPISSKDDAFYTDDNECIITNNTITLRAYYVSNFIILNMFFKINDKYYICIGFKFSIESDPVITFVQLNDAVLPDYNLEENDMSEYSCNGIKFKFGRNSTFNNKYGFTVTVSSSRYN